MNETIMHFIEEHFIVWHMGFFAFSILFGMLIKSIFSSHKVNNANMAIITFFQRIFAIVIAIAIFLMLVFAVSDTARHFFENLTGIGR